MTDKWRVGVTLHVQNSPCSIWQNGIFQNCFFLAKMLQHLPDVEFSGLVIDREDTSDLPESLWIDATEIPVIGLSEAMQTLNVLIEMSALLPEDWAHRFRAKGGRYYWMRVGNDYFLDMERTVYNKRPTRWATDKQYDGVWTLPEYEHSCKDYFELTTRAPVFIVPHLWVPHFLQKGIDRLPAGLFYGFSPATESWRMAVLEPNNNLLKTALLPILAVEKAYQRDPRFLQSLEVCNSLIITRHPDFDDVMRKLSISQAGLLYRSGRTPTPWFMAENADAVVSHHWENGQNYLHYELLYGGYPLIHNSEFLEGCGYYYADTNVNDAAQKLLEAHKTHAERRVEERQKWLRLENQLSIYNEENQWAYARLLTLQQPTRKP